MKDLHKMNISSKKTNNKKIIINKRIILILFFSFLIIFINLNFKNKKSIDINHKSKINYILNNEENMLNDKMKFSFYHELKNKDLKLNSILEV